MVFANADLVLVASLSRLAELLAKNNVTSRRLFVVYVHLDGRPPAERGGDVDGWLHTRLGEGDGRVAGHGVVCRGEERG